jgi:hypothetical protein
MKIKQNFRKSKESIVRSWIVANRQLVGVDKSASWLDSIVADAGNGVFTFSWSGITGSIECGARVKPSTLKINQSINQ